MNSLVQEFGMQSWGRKGQNPAVDGNPTHGLERRGNQPQCLWHSQTGLRGKQRQSQKIVVWIWEMERPGRTTLKQKSRESEAGTQEHLMCILAVLVIGQEPVDLMA